MYKVFLSVIGAGTKRVRPYIERIEATTVDDAEKGALERVEEVYPGSKAIVDEIYLKVK